MATTTDTSELDLVDNLRQDFIADSADTIREFDATLAGAEADDATLRPLVGEGRRIAVAIRGQAQGLGLGLLAVVAHRFEDFLNSPHAPAGQALGDIQRYVDTLLDILDGRIAAESDAAALVRRLPAKPGFDTSNVAWRDVEVLMVSSPGLVPRMLQRELQACGYRVSTTDSTFEALRLTIATRPDLVAISAVMPGLSGVDLAMALNAMPETRNIPVMVITSFDRDHPTLKPLPPTIPVVRKGAGFGDDLSAALKQHFLL